MGYELGKKGYNSVTVYIIFSHMGMIKELEWELLGMIESQWAVISHQTSLILN